MHILMCGKCSSDPVINIIIVIVTELFNNIFIVSSLRIKPVNGGIPPNDSILTEISVVHIKLRTHYRLDSSLRD